MTNETNAPSIDLDVAWADDLGETLASACDELTRELRVTWQVVVPFGPGGGWPVVRFEAQTNDDLVALLRRYDPTNDTGLWA